LWYRIAAAQGDSLAEFSLGWAYLQGRGVETNANEALIWLKRAGAQNQPDALIALGDIYLKGRESVPIDYNEACQWFQKAYRQGRIDALNSVGFIYEHGAPPHLAPNPKKAFECYREAASQGDARAQMNLGRMCRSGSGVDRDYVESYKWFYLAERDGEPVAKHYLQEFQGYSPLWKTALTPQQIAEAVRRADEWQKSFDEKKREKNVQSAK
jgi:TPR repeat protein